VRQARSLRRPRRPPAQEERRVDGGAELAHEDRVQAKSARLPMTTAPLPAYSWPTTAYMNTRTRRKYTATLSHWESGRNTSAHRGGSGGASQGGYRGARAGGLGRAELITPCWRRRDRGSAEVAGVPGMPKNASSVEDGGSRAAVCRAAIIQSGECLDSVGAWAHL